MVLIEAMAAGTGVVASAIAGYSDVVTNGVDGVLVPPADPQALAEELQLLAHEPERIKAMGDAGRRSAERYAWPRIAEEVAEVYERAVDPAPAPIWPPEEIARRTGLVRIDGGPKVPAKRLPSLEPTPVDGRSAASLCPQGRRRVASILGLGLTALAARRIGVDQVAATSSTRPEVGADRMRARVGAMRSCPGVAIVRAAPPATTCAVGT
jgi:phosphatidylinositol alpha-mannosyltransferase